jgi:hypothetical protein
MNAAKLLKLTKDKERSWIILHFHVRELSLPLAVDQEKLLFVNDLSAHYSALWMDNSVSWLNSSDFKNSETRSFIPILLGNIYPYGMLLPTIKWWVQHFREGDTSNENKLRLTRLSVILKNVLFMFLGKYPFALAKSGRQTLISMWWLWRTSWFTELRLWKFPGRKSHIRFRRLRKEGKVFPTMIGPPPINNHWNQIKKFTRWSEL